MSALLYRCLWPSHASLALLLAACGAETPEPKLTDTSSSIQEIDQDKDGFPDWSTASNPERADCDDLDPSVTPEKERYVAAGPFQRGREEDPWASPVREITLSGYCMDRYEVTNQDFLPLLQEREDAGFSNLDESGHRLYDIDDIDDFFEARFVEQEGIWSITPGYEAHPVLEVWYSAAIYYCAWRGRSLPTEAQWEKAARGKLDERRFPWGDSAPSCALVNFVDAPEGVPPWKGTPCVHDTTPVGSYPEGSSPYGLLDMAGNVSEWVFDWFDPDYYAKSPTEDPTGPSEGQLFDDGQGEYTARVARGGGFMSGPEPLAVSYRFPEPDGATSNALGFRCVRALDDPAR